MLLFSFVPRIISIVLATSLLGLGACPEKSPVSNAVSSTEQQGVKPTDFDGKRAFENVRKQVDFGPHPAGSPAIKQVQQYIMDELKSYGLNVKTQAFKPTTPQ